MIVIINVIKKICNLKRKSGYVCDAASNSCKRI